MSHLLPGALEDDEHLPRLFVPQVVLPAQWARRSGPGLGERRPRHNHHIPPRGHLVEVMARDLTQPPFDPIAGHRRADTPTDHEPKTRTPQIVAIHRQDHQRMGPRSALLPHPAKVSPSGRAIGPRPSNGGGP